MPDSEAAALTEQIAELLAEHQRIPMFDGSDGQRCSGGCDELRGEPDGPNSPRHAAHVAAILAARLADSRPAVTEAAVEAAAEALHGINNDPIPDEDNIPPWSETTERHREEWLEMARAALSAALPHMGDGPTDRELLAKGWKEGYAEGIIHMGMSIDDHRKQVGNPYLDRLSPTGDDSE